MSASRLLTLPREIRDEILWLVLTAHRQPPQTVAEIEQECRKNLHEVTEMSDIRYLTNSKAYEPLALPLLLVNRQINAETIQTLERLPAQGTQYHLDVKFVREGYLVPTWVSVPRFATRVNQVTAVFQTCGFVKNVPRGQLIIWRSGSGGPAINVWLFYDLLVKFLRKGPVGEGEQERCMSVETLEVDFVDPEELDAMPDEGQSLNDFIRDLGRPGDSQPPDYDRILAPRPEWICDLLIPDLKGLLSMQYHFADYGGLLYERIGKIVLKANGQVRKEFHLASMLEYLVFGNPFSYYRWDERIDQWFAWKNHAAKERTRLGLGIVRFQTGWEMRDKKIAEEMYRGRTPGRWVG